MKSVRIGIGYCWDPGGVRRDERWKVLRDWCRVTAETGRAMAAAEAKRGVSTEDDEARPAANSGTHPFPSLPRVRVTRLRASAGSFIWESIKEHIEASDILVFDISPSKAGTVSGNVWIEIGYALAQANKRVFLVHSEKDGYKSIPSDLTGLMIGHVPSGKVRHTDQSLRTSIANEICRLVTLFSQSGLITE